MKLSRRNFFKRSAGMAAVAVVAPLAVAEALQAEQEAVLVPFVQTEPITPVSAVITSTTGGMLEGCVAYWNRSSQGEWSFQSVSGGDWISIDDIKADLYGDIWNLEGR